VPTIETLKREKAIIAKQLRGDYDAAILVKNEILKADLEKQHTFITLQ